MFTVSLTSAGIDLYLLILQWKLSPEIVFWIYDTFDYNFENEDDFIDYLKEICR